MQHPAEAYFTQLHASLGVGVPETSGYPALANLLNAVGESLKPTNRVLTCTIFNGIFGHPAFLVTTPFLVFRMTF